MITKSIVVWLQIAWLGLLVMSCGQSASIHRVEPHGFHTPDDAWQAWVYAIERQDYGLIRQVIGYREMSCTGMELIALNPKDTKAVDLCIADHQDPSLKSMVNPQSPLYTQSDLSFHARFEQLWQQRMAKFRTAFLPHLNDLKQRVPRRVTEDHFVISYPRACWSDDGQFLGFNEFQTNELSLRQGKQGWFIADFSCHHWHESECDDVGI